MTIHSLNWALRDHSPRERALLEKLEGPGKVRRAPQSNSSCCWRWDKGYQLPGATERKCCILMPRAAAAAAKATDRHRDINGSSGGHQRPLWSQYKWNANRKRSKDAWHRCSRLCQKNTHCLTVPVGEIVYHSVVISPGFTLSHFSAALFAIVFSPAPFCPDPPNKLYISRSAEISIWLTVPPSYKTKN